MSSEKLFNYLAPKCKISSEFLHGPLCMYKIVTLDMPFKQSNRTELPIDFFIFTLNITAASGPPKPVFV